jgi:hypothetical protein
LIDTTGGKRFFAKLCLEVSCADKATFIGDCANGYFREFG